MNPLNYGNSFITGLWSENRVRFWVESRTRLIDEEAGITEDYYQCGSCKGEDTFAKKDLWRPDNFDFLPVFGPEYGLIFVRRVHLHDGYRETRLVKDMWKGQRYSLHQHQDVELLGTNERIREVTHDCVLLVAQNEIVNAELGLRAIIEYPVKTMNIHDERNMYQVDTGPILLPDLSTRYPRLVDSLSLAFVAFNAPDFAEFVIEVPTPIVEDGSELAKTYHYSKFESLRSENRLYGVDN